MNEYELTVSSKIEKEYFIEADCYEDAIQKAVDYYLADNEEAGENKITNIKVELKTSEELEELLNTKDNVITENNNVVNSKDKEIEELNAKIKELEEKQMLKIMQLQKIKKLKNQMIQ